jgi:hypothetical protein
VDAENRLGRRSAVRVGRPFVEIVHSPADRAAIVRLERILAPPVAVHGAPPVPRSEREPAVPNGGRNTFLTDRRMGRADGAGPRAESGPEAETGAESARPEPLFFRGFGGTLDMP